MLQFVASDFVLRHLIYSQAAGSLPEDWLAEPKPCPLALIWSVLALCASTRQPSPPSLAKAGSPSRSPAKAGSGSGSCAHGG